MLTMLELFERPSSVDRLRRLDLEAGFRTLAVDRRRRQSARARVLRWGLVLLGAGVLLATVLGFAFAGSPKTLPEGTRIAGVDVGGLRAGQARAVLEQRAEQTNDVPVVFTSGERRWRIAPSDLDLEVDWGAAVAAAQERGDGVGPFRGLRRLGLRVFGTDVPAPAVLYRPALDDRLDRVARALDRPARDAAIRLRGLRPVVVPARSGLVLHREAAEHVVVASLTGFRRDQVPLPVRFDRPTITAADLAPALTQTRRALSAPVRLSLGPTRWRVPRWRLARLLDLPSGGQGALAVGGPRADAYFKRLRGRVDQKPANATWRVMSTGRIRLVPHRPGMALDVEATSKALLAAAVEPGARLAKAVVATTAPTRTTAEARAMGITGTVGSYTTIYGGEANRIHNVQLVANLIDGTLIKPGGLFSFNATTGERTAEKGFLEAPVIINGELQTGLGGGVCQVSTTVFNAAYEAGLPFETRTNHALYISHYPQGRDATVNYPDIDLQFYNDTGRWLLLRTFVGSSSLTVNLYGRPTGRRVESETAPLVETGAAPSKRTADPALTVGTEVVDEYGQPSRSTSVHRKVYAADGELLYDSTWYSSYRAEPTEIRYGTKPKPKPVAEPKKPPKEGQPPAPPPEEPAPGTTTTPAPRP